jgi:hypothetical protein
LSTEVNPKLKILPLILALSINVVCCLSVLLSIFLSERTTETKPQQACKVIPLSLADTKKPVSGKFFLPNTGFFPYSGMLIVSLL